MRFKTLKELGTYTHPYEDRYNFHLFATERIDINPLFAVFEIVPIVQTVIKSMTEKDLLKDLREDDHIEIINLDKIKNLESKTLEDYKNKINPEVVFFKIPGLYYVFRRISTLERFEYYLRTKVIPDYFRAEDYIIGEGASNKDTLYFRNLINADANNYTNDEVKAIYKFIINDLRKR